MNRARAGALGVLLVALTPALALAQGAPPGDEFGPPPPAGPPQGPAPRPAEPEAEPTVSLGIAASIGVAVDNDLDRALGALGYDDAGAVIGGDATLLFGATPWLWLGGRLEFRARDWPREGQPSAAAAGWGLLAVAEARLALGRTLSFGLSAGVGGGLASMRLGDATDTPLAPAAFGGLRLAARIGTGAYLFGRFEYDYFRASNLRNTRLDLDLGGVGFAFGLEARR